MLQHYGTLCFFSVCTRACSCPCGLFARVHSVHTSLHLCVSLPASRWMGGGIFKKHTAHVSQITLTSLTTTCRRTPVGSDSVTSTFMFSLLSFIVYLIKPYSHLSRLLSHCTMSVLWILLTRVAFTWHVVLVIQVNTYLWPQSITPTTQSWHVVSHQAVPQDHLFSYWMLQITIHATDKCWSAVFLHSNDDVLSMVWQTNKQTSEEVRKTDYTWNLRHSPICPQQLILIKQLYCSWKTRVDQWLRSRMRPYCPSSNWLLPNKEGQKMCRYIFTTYVRL